MTPLRPRPDLGKMFPIKDAGDYVSDWANKQFGSDFSKNKFRDGSAFAPAPEKAKEEQSPIRIIIEIQR